MDCENPFHLTDAEFDVVMEEIDQGLRQEPDKIPGRELRGWSEFCKKFNVSLSLDDPLAERIIAWFDQRYGERLKLDLDFGKSIAVVRGDFYRMNCFRLYGTVYAVCAPSLIGKRLAQRGPTGDIEIVNLLDGSIDGLTRDFAGRLPAPNCEAILYDYERMFVAFSSMEAAVGAPYVKEAIGDLAESAEALLRTKPNYGQSNWASLQATEKIVKSCILEKRAAHERHHRLAELFAEASRLGLPPISRTLIEAIQCTPNVRYDSGAVGRDKALAAHHAALQICGKLSLFVRRQTSQSLAQRVIITGCDQFPTPALVLTHVPPRPPLQT